MSLCSLPYPFHPVSVVLVVEAHAVAAVVVVGVSLRLPRLRAPLVSVADAAHDGGCRADGPRRACLTLEAGPLPVVEHGDDLPLFPASRLIEAGVPRRRSAASASALRIFFCARFGIHSSHFLPLLGFCLLRAAFGASSTGGRYSSPYSAIITSLILFCSTRPLSGG